MIFLVVVSVIILLFGFVVFFGAPYLPSHHNETKQAFEELYPLSRSDVLVDIGSGDGIILRLAAERGARAVGYELNPALVVLSRFLSRKHQGVRVVTANFWRSHLPKDTTVVYIFSVSRDGKRMAKWLQQETDLLGRPLSVVTYGSRLPGIKPAKKHRAHCLYEFKSLQSTKA